MKLIRVYGHWNDNVNDKLYGTLCVIRAESIDETDEDGIFYYFSKEEEVIGRHFDFTVISYKEAYL